MLQYYWVQFQQDKGDFKLIAYKPPDCVDSGELI